jgi:RimJ/RimL family protein N-acetyltransferase/molybdopterin-guanine dinucleotide biosynthesis protein A
MTERCSIERPQPHHAAALAAYRSDPSVAIFQDWATPFTLSDATSFIESMAQSAPLTPGEWFQFAVVDKASGELAGDVAIRRHDDGPSVLTLGYTLARRFWGRGLATEAVSAVLDHAVALTGATRVTADALAANEPSVRLLERLGFSHVGTNERVEQIDGVWHDDLLFELTPPTPPPAVGAVLAGGASTRMGAPKSLTEIGGATMFDHVTRALVTAGLDVVVSGSAPTPPHAHPVVPDDERHEGPAAGVAALLADAGGRPVFVTAVDQPYLSPPTIRRLVSHVPEAPAVIPVDDETLQVTCATYRRAFADALEKAVEEPLRSVAQRVAHRVEPAAWRSWGEDGRSWRSLDTPESVTAALEELGPPIRGG